MEKGRINVLNLEQLMILLVALLVEEEIEENTQAEVYFISFLYIWTLRSEC